MDWKSRKMLKRGGQRGRGGRTAGNSPRQVQRCGNDRHDPVNFWSTRPTKEKGRDGDNDRDVERQVKSYFRLGFFIAVVERVDDVFLIGTVPGVRGTARDKVAHEGETLLTEVKVVDVAKDERE